MIRAEHVREEVQNAKKVIENPDSSVDDKLNVLFKLITVVLKVVLNVRTNTTLVMKELKVQPIDSKKRRTEGEGTDDVKKEKSK